jgi:hypothetical protein
MTKQEIKEKVKSKASSCFNNGVTLEKIMSEISPDKNATPHATSNLGCAFICLSDKNLVDAMLKGKLLNASKKKKENFIYLTSIAPKL